MVCFLSAIEYQIYNIQYDVLKAVRQILRIIQPLVHTVFNECIQ